MAYDPARGPFSKYAIAALLGKARNIRASWLSRRTYLQGISPGPVDPMVEEERLKIDRRKLHKLVVDAELSWEDRKLLYLWIHGWTLPKIAEEFGTNLQAIATRFRGRAYSYDTRLGKRTTHRPGILDALREAATRNGYELADIMETIK